MTSRAALQFLLRYLLVGFLALLVVVFSHLAPNFSDWGNLLKICQTASIAAIMYLGLTWVIAAGEIDVSFMQVAALTDMLIAALVLQGVGWPLAIAVGIGGGLAIGVINGLLVVVLRIPSLIATIGTAGIALSAAAALGEGKPIYITVPPGLNATITGTVGGLPSLVLLALAVYLVGWFVQDRLVFGHYVYSIEQNRRAVVEAGIPSRRIVFLLFLLSSLAASIAGLLLTVTLASGQPNIGQSFFVDGLTAVLLGAMALRIGQPNVLGTMVGVLILATLVNGVTLIGWPNYMREIMKGVLLLAGVLVVTRGRRILARSGAAVRDRAAPAPAPVPFPARDRAAPPRRAAH